MSHMNHKCWDIIFIVKVVVILVVVANVVLVVVVIIIDVLDVLAKTTGLYQVQELTTHFVGPPIGPPV